MSLTKVTYSMISGAQSNILDFGASTSSSDNYQAFSDALAYVSSLGGGVVNIPPGIFIVRNTILMPDNCALQGSGQYTTTIKLGNSVNKNIVSAKTNTGSGVGIYDLTLDGNQDNNVNGGVYLIGTSGLRGPTFVIERVTVTHCRDCVMTTGIKTAFLLFGSDWCVLRDVDIIRNDYCYSALWVACPDSQFDGVYVGTNGRSTPPQAYSCGVYITGATNLFTNCYFGGTQNGPQVLFKDASAKTNMLVNCMIDNAATHGVMMLNGADGNMFANCRIGNSSYSDGGTYYSIFSTAGDNTGSMFSNCQIYSNYATAYATNGYFEPSYLIGTSQFSNCSFNGTFTGGPVSIGANSLTTFTNCSGYDYGNANIVRRKRYTVSQLPAAATAGNGAAAFVTDATATTFASIVAGGGANAVPVYCNGTNWLIG